MGVRRLGGETFPESIPEKQAAAAIGQIDLCRRFERAFARRDRLVGQLLLTHRGLSQRERFLNARHTFHELIHGGIVPLVNENDSVATEELRFGDNDELSALVVNSCGADLLIMLTDTDGLHDRPPGEGGGRRIGELDEITPQVLRMAGGARSKLASGGMRSKLEAARVVARFGIPTVIADGRRRGVLHRILGGEDIGTLVHAAENQLSARKHWIAFSQKTRGTLRLDTGAVRAVCERGGSLLPIGVVGADGKFQIGDLVSCVSEDGREIARGLTSYDATETDVIKGHRTSRISELLGYSNGDEIIHRDDLILL
jgi:glutamate 5-kinase